VNLVGCRPILACHRLFVRYSWTSLHRQRNDELRLNSGTIQLRINQSKNETLRVNESSTAKIRARNKAPDTRKEIPKGTYAAA
jgi:hypothetical protein